MRQDDALEERLRLYDITSGEVLIAGEHISEMSDHTRTRFTAEYMSFIFQSYNLMPVLSAVENVELPLLVAGAKPKDVRKKALRALAIAGVVWYVPTCENGFGRGFKASKNARPKGARLCRSCGASEA